jgi:hypothetical protein
MGSRGQEPLPLRSSWLERNSLAHASAHPSEDLRRTSQGVQFFPLRRHVHRFNALEGFSRAYLSRTPRRDAADDGAHGSVFVYPQNREPKPALPHGAVSTLRRHWRSKSSPPRERTMRRVKRRQPRSCEACDNGSWKDRREYVWVSAHLRGRTPVDRSDAVRRDAAHRTAC